MMIDYRDMKSIVDIKIGFSDKAFKTCVIYTDEALGDAPPNTPKKSDTMGFVFPIHAPSLLRFSFDESLAGWKFDENPIRFRTPTGCEFSSAIYPSNFDFIANFNLQTEHFSIIDHWRTLGLFLFDLYMIDSKGNKIIIDPVANNHKP